MRGARGQALKQGQATSHPHRSTTDFESNLLEALCFERGPDKYTKELILQTLIHWQFIITFFIDSFIFTSRLRPQIAEKKKKKKGRGGGVLN